MAFTPAFVMFVSIISFSLGTVVMRYFGKHKDVDSERVAPQEEVHEGREVKGKHEKKARGENKPRRYRNLHYNDEEAVAIQAAKGETRS